MINHGYSEKAVFLLYFRKEQCIKCDTTSQFNIWNFFSERRIVPPAFRKGMNVFGVRRPKRASHSTTTVLTLSMANVRIGWTLRESRHTTVWTAPPCQTVLPVWRDLAVVGVETITIPKSGSVWVVGFLVSAQWLS